MYTDAEIRQAKDDAALLAALFELAGNHHLTTVVRMGVRHWTASLNRSAKRADGRPVRRQARPRPFLGLDQWALLNQVHGEIADLKRLQGMAQRAGDRAKAHELSIRLRTIRLAPLLAQEGKRGPEPKMMKGAL